MPNAFSYVAILSWPFVIAIFFTHLEPRKAIIISMTSAYLLLPAGFAFKLPVLPFFDKFTITAICIATACAFNMRLKVIPRDRSRLVDFLIIVYIACPILTGVTNTDEITRNGRVIPAVGLYDAGSTILNTLTYFMPYLIARRYLCDERSLKLLIQSIFALCMLYTIPMLLEIRISPQLHTWVYGYFPHEFSQQYRSGGYRPVVFLGHGLLVALFAAIGVLAGFILLRSGVLSSKRAHFMQLTFLLVVQILCKTFSATAYAFSGALCILLTSPRMQARIAICIGAIAISYPILRISDVVATETLVSIVAEINVERSESLKFRFEQERELLTIAQERLAAGWGRFGRSRNFDEEGTDRSVSDGRWIVTLGAFGVIGFVSEFLLLFVPVLMISRALRWAPERSNQFLLAGTALMIAFIMLDQIPNSSLNSWIWMIVGAAQGRIEHARLTKKQPQHYSPSSSSLTSLFNDGRDAVGGRIADKSQT